MPPSSAPQRRARHDTHTISAGTREDPSTFTADHANESLVAAYLGFCTTGELRKFILSHHILSYFRLHDEGHSRDVHRKAILNDIRDHWLDRAEAQMRLQLDTIELHRPGAKPDIGDRAQMSKYKGEQARYLARIVVLFVEDHRSKPSTVKVNGHEQRKMMDELSSTRSYCANIPGVYNITEVSRPVFAPNDAEESDLEPFNRALILLKTAQHVLNPTIGERRFLRNGWDQGQSTEGLALEWMKSAVETATTRPEESSSPQCQPSKRAPKGRSSKHSKTDGGLPLDATTHTASDDEDDEEQLPTKLDQTPSRDLEPVKAAREQDLIAQAPNEDSVVAVKKEHQPKKVVDLLSDSDDGSTPQTSGPAPKTHKRNRSALAEVDEDDEEESDLKLELERIETLQKLRKLQKKKRKAA